MHANEFHLFDAIVFSPTRKCKSSNVEFLKLGLNSANSKANSLNSINFRQNLHKLFRSTSPCTGKNTHWHTREFLGRNSQGKCVCQRNSRKIYQINDFAESLVPATHKHTHSHTHTQYASSTSIDLRLHMCANERVFVDVHRPHHGYANQYKSIECIYMQWPQM